MSETLFLEKEERVIKKVGKCKKVSIRYLLSKYPEETRSLEKKGFVKKMKKKKPTDATFIILAEKGRKEYSKKYKK